MLVFGCESVEAALEFLVEGPWWWCPGGWDFEFGIVGVDSISGLDGGDVVGGDGDVVVGGDGDRVGRVVGWVGFEVVF